MLCCIIQTGIFYCFIKAFKILINYCRLSFYPYLCIVKEISFSNQIDKRLDNLYKFFELCHLREVFVVAISYLIIEKKVNFMEIFKTVFVHLTIGFGLTLLGNYIPIIWNSILSVVGSVGIVGGLFNKNA